jgi:hypothetical protein
MKFKKTCGKIKGIDYIENKIYRQRYMNNEEVSVKVFNATFNNISVISWRSFSLVEETRVPGENQRPVASHWQTHHIMVYPVHLAWAGIELTTLGVIGITHSLIGSNTVGIHTYNIALVLKLIWPNHLKLECLYQASKVNDHVYCCYGYRYCV